MKFKNSQRAAINGCIDEIRRRGKYPYLISGPTHTVVESRDERPAPALTMDSARTPPPYRPTDAERAELVRLMPNFYRLR